MQYRIEHDTIGEIEVPADRLWGAQTQRSLQNFSISNEAMPLEVVHAFARLKMACARANYSFGKLDAERRDLIVQVCNEILSGSHDREFPLAVWQTGSGTQTNMNVNEVIANRAAQIQKDNPEKQSLHPNDHVNMSQSSNDTFPSVMHIAAVHAIEEVLFPVLDDFAGLLSEKAEHYKDIVKIGRTHLQDATPLTLGQEISGWAAMITASRHQIASSLPYLQILAIGGTAVGTGLNAPAGFGQAVAEELSKNSPATFISSSNHFHGLTSHDALVLASGAIKGLAANMMKIANDIRWLASGPRCGIGEITIPANEPGSSIMPGKVNPTQAEAVTMVACQVFGNDATIGFAASQGNFELNVFKPVIIYNFLQSVTLISDAVKSFAENCVKGLEPDRDNITRNLNNSLMLVTALNPHIGYENAAKIAKKAHQEKTSLREAAISLNLLTAEEFDRLVDPQKMIKQA